MTQQQKRKSSIANLVDIATKGEQEEKNKPVAPIQEKVEAKEQLSADEQKTELVLQEKKEMRQDLPAIEPEEPVMPGNKIEPNKNRFEAVFTKKDYGVGEKSLKVPIKLHAIAKGLSYKTGIPTQQIIANILDQFFTDYEKEIKKMMRF